MFAINLQSGHSFFPPNKILFGNGTTRSIAQEIHQLGGKKVGAFSTFEAAEAAVEAVEELMETLRMPFRLKDHGIPEQDIPKLVNATMRESRFFVFNPRNLKEEDIRSILEAADHLEKR
jgi:alcohol dehydrogenase class IV